MVTYIIVLISINTEDANLSKKRVERTLSIDTVESCFVWGFNSISHILNEMVCWLSIKKGHLKSDTRLIEAFS